jgi:hypothetical protein
MRVLRHIDQDTLGEIEGEELIEPPGTFLLGGVKGQSRRKSKALVTHSVLQMDTVHAHSRPALKPRAQERRPMNGASQLELAL